MITGNAIFGNHDATPYDNTYENGGAQSAAPTNNYNNLQSTSSIATKPEIVRPVENFDHPSLQYNPVYGSAAMPPDWVLGNEGKYVWDENVTSASDVDLGDREYIGKNLSDVKSHFVENNNWLSRTFGDKNGGFSASTDINSYYDAKVPLAIQDMFNKHKWFYNLKEKGDNRADAGYSARVRNSSIRRILKGHKQTITGSVSLDGVEHNYTAYLGAANNTNLSLIGFFDEHPSKNWTLVNMNGGAITDNMFYLSNSQTGIEFPVLSVYFKNHEAAVNWFLNYSHLRID